MTKIKLIYWVSTVLFSLIMIFSAFQYISNPQMKEAFHHLGFEDYFRIELAVAKLFGCLALLTPMPKTIKEWAYAGFAIVLISASISHYASGDSFDKIIAPAIIGIFFLGSYVTYKKSA